MNEHSLNLHFSHGALPHSVTGTGSMSILVVQDVGFGDFHCSESSVSVLQRPAASCFLLLPPEEEEGMGVQSPWELQTCLGVVDFVPWQRVRLGDQ